MVPDRDDRTEEALLLSMDPLRRGLATRLGDVFGGDRFPQEQYTEPAGDPGLFGPGSVTWRVHGEPAMIVGGLSAVIVQALHPLAMAGVSQHSSYRQAPLARLGRTASFVGVTTFASRAAAEEVIGVVRAIHTRVTGIAPDGRPYAASDPELLRWVHVAEVASFLRAHRRYSPFPVRGADLDRYFDETAVVAERLGATDVPRSRVDVRDYFRAVRPELAATDEAHEALRFIRRPVGDDPMTRACSHVIIEAAVDLLPPWVRGLYGLRRLPAVDAAAVRPAAMTLLTAMRVLIGPSPARLQAEARAAGVLRPSHPG